MELHRKDILSYICKSLIRSIIYILKCRNCNLWIYILIIYYITMVLG